MVMTRLLFFFPNISTSRGKTKGGAEKVFLQLISEIDKSKFEITLIVLKESQDTLMLRKLENVSVIPLEANHLKQSIFKIYKTIKRTDPEVVISTLPHVNFVFSILKKFDRNRKFVLRETTVPSVNQNLNWLTKNIYYKHFINSVDKVICQSEDMKSDLIDNFGVKESLCTVINNPSDPPISSSADEKKSYDVLLVGNLKKQKRIDRLIDIAAYVDKSIQFGILGEGPERKNIENQIQSSKLNNIELLGYKTDAMDYMKAAKVIVLTSDYEGFPNVLIEAGSCGKPVISFDIKGGINEIIEPGINGISVPIGDNVKFAQAIEYALQKDWDENEIRRLTDSKFSLKRIVKSYEDMFTNLL